MSKYYKHPVYKFVKSNEIRVTPDGRFCWVNLVTPKEGMKQDDGTLGKPKFAITQLLPKGDAVVDSWIAETRQWFDEMLVQYNQDSPTELGIKSILKDGDTFDMEKYPFYKNMWVLNATHSDRPKIFNNENPPIDLDPAHVKGGMVGRLVVNLMLTGKGASYQVQAVQFRSDDGVRYGGGVRDYAKVLAQCEPEPEAPEGDAPEAPPVAPEVAAKAAAAEGKRNKGLKAALGSL